MKKKKALKKLRKLKEKYGDGWSSVFPDEVPTKIQQILIKYNFPIWFELVKEFRLIDDDTARLKVEIRLKDKLAIQEVSRFVGNIENSGDYYKIIDNFYLEEITPEDAKEFINKAIEKVSDG